MDLIRICALANSPKEVMIVIQEAIEYLQTRLNHGEDEEDENDPDLVQRAIGIVSLCFPGFFLYSCQERFDRLIETDSYLSIETRKDIRTRIVFSCLGKRYYVDSLRLAVRNEGGGPRARY